MTAQPPVSNSPNQDSTSYVDSYKPPVKPTASPAADQLKPEPISDPKPQPKPEPKVDPKPKLKPTKQGSQSLQSQNIFFLLGVKDGAEDEKEAFLDELQQVIWEDFLANDVQLLITVEEMTQLKVIMAKGDGAQEQEEMIVYLEKLIPDLEEIMLEKALHLKADLVRERIAGMRDYHKENQVALDQLKKGEELVSQDQWQSAAETLNSIGK